MAAEVDRPVRDGLDGSGAERADALTAALLLDDDVCADEAGHVLGDHLLGEIEGLGEGVDGGRAERELVHHGAARWIGQGGEG